MLTGIHGVRLSGLHPLWRQGDERTRRVEQQEPDRLPSPGGSGQLAPVLRDPGGGLGFGTRRVRHAERSANPGQVGDVTITADLVEGPGAETDMGAQKLSASAMCTQVSRRRSEAAYWRAYEACGLLRAPEFTRDQATVLLRPAAFRDRLGDLGPSCRRSRGRSR
jgi:hypothetical protein